MAGGNNRSDIIEVMGHKINIEKVENPHLRRVIYRRVKGDFQFHRYKDHTDKHEHERYSEYVDKYSDSYKDHTDHKEYSKYDKYSEYRDHDRHN